MPDVPRRSFLKVAAAAVAAAIASLTGWGILRRLPAWRRGRGIPALAASGPSTSLVRLAGLPAAGGTTLAFAATPPEPVAAAATRRRWVMVIDLARCDGCRECTRACTALHVAPAGQEWLRVYEMRDHHPAAAPYWLPRPCMQCDNPPCVKACPVSATWKREDGIVMQDTSRCIGCRFCMAACPYQARSFNWADQPATEDQQRQPYSIEWNLHHPRGTVEKCIFCPGLLREGKLPACAAACPMGAIYMGDQAEDAATNSQGETVRFSEVIREHAAYRFMENLGTEPRVYYLPPRRRIYPPPPDETAPRETREPVPVGAARVHR